MSFFNKISNLISKQSSNIRHQGNDTILEDADSKTTDNNAKTDNIPESKASFNSRIKTMSVNADIANLIWFADGEHKNYENIGIEDWRFGNDLGYVKCTESSKIEEPSLIYTSLKVEDGIGQIDCPDYAMSYKEMTPEQRGVYWDFLKSPYNKSNIDLFPVRLFGFGLERHLLFGNYKEAIRIIYKLQDAYQDVVFHDSYFSSAIMLAAIIHRDSQIANDLFDRASSKLNGWKTYPFNKELFLFTKYILELPITSEDIIRCAYSFGYKKRKYLQKRTSAFKREIENQINSRFNTDTILLSEVASPSELTQCSWESNYLLHNISLADSISIPNITECESIKTLIFDILYAVHQTFEDGIISSKSKEWKKQSEEDNHYIEDNTVEIKLVDWIERSNKELDIEKSTSLITDDNNKECDIHTNEASESRPTLGEQYHIDSSKYNDIPVSDMDFSARVNNCLARHNPPIDTVNQLLQYSLFDLYRIESFGQKCADEIKNKVELLKEEEYKSIDKEMDQPIITNGDLLESTISLKDRYNINPLSCKDISINDMGFSVRVNNCLARHNPPIKTVGDLLVYSYADLSSIRNFGRQCCNDIESKLRYLKRTNRVEANDYENVETDSKISYAASFIRQHKDDLIAGDLTFLDQLENDENEKQLQDRIIAAYSDLGIDLIRTALTDADSIKPIASFINDEVREYEALRYKRRQIDDALRLLPPERLSNKIKGFIYAYTSNDEQRNELLTWLSSSGYTRFSDLHSSRDCNSTNLITIIRFLEWCSFDLKKDIESFVVSIYRNDRDKEVIQERAKGNTLNDVGNKCGVTRERIRQIEQQVRKKFTARINRSKIILKIYAIRDQDDVLTPVELSEYFGDNTEEILYLLRTSDCASYVYDRYLDVCIVANNGLSERTARFIESLPDTFNESKIDSFIQIGEDDYDLGDEIIEKAIEKSFKHTGKVYHRSRLKLSEIYDYVLRKYYPDGIWIYGKEELQDFKKHVLSDFGDIRFTDTERAFIARISNIGILCDKGIYKAKTDKYISDELAVDIYNYVEDSDNTIFLTNTIYSVFEDRLLDEGVTNKYYLQGVLHELFGDKWAFSRDYISKDQDVTSVYTEIINYIKDSVYPVSKKELISAFPGVTDIVINFATSEPEIVNLFGKYIHESRLSISDKEYAYMEQLIDSSLINDKICNCRTLYDYYTRTNKYLLSKNYIDSSFALYSVLENKFRKKYSFSRPFIAQKGTEIGTVADVLKEMVSGSDEIDVDDIASLAREHNLVIYSILGFVNSCNGTHLLVDEHTVMNIELTGIDEKVAKDVESLIYEEIKDKGTVPIANLESISLLPAVELNWNEWLVYSVINKWGDRLEVGTSSNQFRHSVPLISIKGEMDESQYSGISSEQIGHAVTPDDLTNIDELLMDFSEDDWSR